MPTYTLFFAGIATLTGMMSLLYLQDPTFTFLCLYNMCLSNGLDVSWLTGKPIKRPKCGLC